MKEGITAVLLGGGMGKIICSSSILPKLKEKYGELIIVNPYPEVFNFNPNISRNLTYNERYLYEDYLREIPVLVGEPYLTNAYRFGPKHLIEAYCDIFKLEYSSDMRPQLFLSPEEEAFGKQQVQQIGNYIVMHITGGTSYYSPQNANNKPIHSRDWASESAQQFVELFRKKYPNIKIVQMALPTEPQLKNVQVTNMPSRMLFPIIKHALSFVVIDGFVNHVSAAFDKKGIVLWGGTDPRRLSYPHNTNLVLDYKCSMKFCSKTDFASHLGCKEMSCREEYVCMKHKPEIVLDHLSKILDSKEIENVAPVGRCNPGECKK